MSQRKRRTARPEQPPQAAPKKEEPVRKTPQRSAGRSALRFILASLFVLGVVWVFSGMTRLLADPKDSAIRFAAAEITGTPTPVPTPSPVPTITPTPRAYAPFGAQYGYGGEDLIEETEGTLFTPQPTEAPTPEPQPTAEGYATLRKGAQGEDVQRMQQALISLGYLNDTADGSFGANTLSAVTFFQAVNSLTADGIAGQKTLTLLYSGSALPASAAPAMDFLILVNRQHMLDTNYMPSGLVSIESVLSSDIVKVKYKGTRANKTAVEALGRMLKDAEADGVSGWQISSAFRTGADQQKLVDNSVAAYLRNHSDWSRKQALSATYNTVAPAGASEHQTGLAFDVTVPGVSFAGTPQQKWLHKHCHEYGFVVRFTAEKQKITGFIAEAWHIRYVGTEAAAIMTQNNWCLEEYAEHMGLLKSQ